MDLSDARQSDVSKTGETVAFLKKALPVFLVCGFAASLSAAPAPQQQQNATPPSQQQGAAAQPPEGIVADNLDRVAATAEQILEVLNKDAGLMVEFKRLLAEDAGNGGQILDEQDLKEGAVAEQLRRDLRTRVLATRLLQRYGYLLPKINPDSELAAEHNLAMRERAARVERAADRDKAPPQTVVNVAPAIPAQGSAASPPPTAVEGVLDNTRRDVLPPPHGEQRGGDAGFYASGEHRDTGNRWACPIDGCFCFPR